MTTRSDIGALEASGLIGLAAMQPELEYLFRHVLVQDAAYGSLLKQERRELHRRVADALLELYPERRRELAGVIGMHLEEAGEPRRAAPFLVDAGDQALARFANREARALYDRAFAALPADASDEETVRLRARAGVGSVRSGWTFMQSTMDVDRLTELAPVVDRLDDLRLASEVHFWNAFIRRFLGETAETSAAMRASTERLRELSARGGDPKAAALPEALMAVGMIFSGQLREGAQMLERALSAFDDGDDPVGTGQLYRMLTLAYARLGDFAAAERNQVRADRLTERGDPIAKLDGMMMLAIIASERGELDEAVDLSEQCARTSEELGATLCAIPANYFLGDGRLRQGDAAAAKPRFERILELTAPGVAGTMGFAVLGRAGLAAALVRLGDAPAPEDWERALDGARAIGDVFSEATVRARRATALAREPGADMARALEDLEAAIGIFERIEARPALARALRAYSIALERAGRADDARAARERAERVAKELGLRDREAAA